MYERWRARYTTFVRSLGFDEISSFLLTYPFAFFACAKKVTKKAQPILMRDLSPVELFLGQNRRPEAELNRTLLVEQQTRRYESFRSSTRCRVGVQDKFSKAVSMEDFERSGRAPSRRPTKNCWQKRKARRRDSAYSMYNARHVQIR